MAARRDERNEGKEEERPPPSPPPSPPPPLYADYDETEPSSRPRKKLREAVRTPLATAARAMTTVEDVETAIALLEALRDRKWQQKVDADRREADAARERERVEQMRRISAASAWNQPMFSLAALGPMQDVLAKLGAREEAVIQSLNRAARQQLRMRQARCTARCDDAVVPDDCRNICFDRLCTREVADLLRAPAFAQSHGFTLTFREFQSPFDSVFWWPPDHPPNRPFGAQLTSLDIKPERAHDDDDAAAHIALGLAAEFRLSTEKPADPNWPPLLEQAFLAEKVADQVSQGWTRSQELFPWNEPLDLESPEAQAVFWQASHVFSRLAGVDAPANIVMKRRRDTLRAHMNLHLTADQAARFLCRFIKTSARDIFLYQEAPPPPRTVDLAPYRVLEKWTRGLFKTPTNRLEVAPNAANRATLEDLERLPPAMGVWGHPLFHTVADVLAHRRAAAAAPR